jgi:GMP synthase-like glutamine amidotransferase
MLPVAIFRHAVVEGPGYLADFLDERAIPWQLIAIDANDAVPPSVSTYSGLVFMGGPMSVNDDLPWIAGELDLIRDAVAQGVPVLGHCLGGQLISKALGGVVSKNPVKEIGWGRVPAKTMPRTTGLASLKLSRLSTGTVKLLRCQKAPYTCCRVSTASIRDTPSARIWPCNVISK